MSYLTIQYGSGIIYKKIEILENDITYNNLKERICDNVFCREYYFVKVEKNYELFHNNEIINMDEEIDFHKNPLNIVFITKYYKNGKIFINPLKDIENKTLENCKDEFDKDWQIIVFEENQTDELCRYAIDKDYRQLGCVKNQTDELCRYAIDKDYRALKFIDNPTKKICYYAINKSNGNALQYIKNKTYRICKCAININIEAIKFANIEIDKLVRITNNKLGRLKRKNKN